MALACQIDSYKRDLETQVEAVEVAAGSDGLLKVTVQDSVLFPEGMASRTTTSDCQAY